MEDVRTGLDQVLSQPPATLRGRRLGLLTNPSGIDRRLRSAVDLFAEHPALDLRALFGPEHGVRGNLQAGDHVDSGSDPRTGLPVFSLYGETRTPTPEMLDGIDTLVIDIQDIGVRYATYLSSVAYAIAGCATAGVDVVVLDRPNPLGGETVAGNLLDPAFESFVGIAGLSILHGLTIGEFARWWAAGNSLPEPAVVPMRGWRRSMWFDDTALPWVFPSPNLPTLNSVTCYPATCLVEGTNLSEGRGTTRPFEVFGAPWIDADDLAADLNALGLPAVGFRPVWFNPWISKNAGETCGGAQLYVHDRNGWDPLATGFAILSTVKRRYPEHFAWVESTEGGTFVDLLAGTDQLRKWIDSESDLTTLLGIWGEEAATFAADRQEWLLPDYDPASPERKP